MALINKVLPGYVATLWCQDDASPTALTDTQLSSWTSVGGIIGASAGGTGTSSTGLQVPVEAIPPFGSDDAFAAYAVAGARTGAKITTQNQVTSMTITCAWNPADPAQLLIRNDGYNGTIIRTYAVAVYDGTNTVAYAFNARVGGLKWDMSPSAEGKFEFTIHPTGGNSYGWSNNT
ncbi:hypothetical protein UFOVP79_29 [uncultured Caudovirales phage]|uniref:Uncharacterized protein n=1 Tax=uncultured Caudovirales phage TaxID=2100421 RepID=A0A6J5L0V3_9CAUD|nr:hypothetical protein UFOVP79_29 [uncultured Caudovirales phage]